MASVGVQLFFSGVGPEQTLLRSVGKAIPTAMLDWWNSLFGGLSASQWINLTGFFSTPMICMWFFPNVRALAAGVVITAAFWMFYAVRAEQDLPFVLISTPVVAAICGALCFAVLLLRRAFPATASQEDASTASDVPHDIVARRPDPLRPWMQAIAAGGAVVIVVLVLWSFVSQPH